ncbi:MAG: transketolase C-terminal domain-containing protein [Rhizomicrobium sp.]
MRNAFASEVTALAQGNPNIVLLSGDIGNRLFDKFKDAAPERFHNVGVAEANMIGVAAGMAMAGLRPITYTITSFTTARCLEQIRVDVCYHNLPVVIVGVGSGLGYASLGVTHHSCEDVAFLGALPNMTVLAPADAFETRAALRAAVAHDGPVYIRLGKKGEPKVHSSVPEDFKIGKGIVMTEGDAVCIIASGTVLPVALEAGRRLTQAGLPARVVSLHTVKPMDEDLLAQCAARFPVIATVEEHSILGGVAARVSQWMTANQITTTRHIPFATGDWFLKTAGEQDYAREQYGITTDAIFEKVHAAAAARQKIQRTA